jgi:DNA repair exonuclease SbcCD ATPase subunit
MDGRYVDDRENFVFMQIVLIFIKTHFVKTQINPIMKKALYLIGLLLVPGVLLGQKPIEVSGTDFKLGQDTYSGVQVLIPEAAWEQVESMWIKALEKGTKSKVSEAHQGEITIFGAFIKSIGEDPVNIYSQIIPRDSIVELNTCIELKRNEFITENLYESEFNQLKAYLHDFGKEAYIEEAEEQLEAEENVLKELERGLKQLQNDKESMEKKISKNEHDITVSEDDIRILDADIAVKNEELARAKVRLGSVGDDLVQRETIETEIKDLEKEKKKMLKSVEKEKKNIVGYNSDIDNTKLEIPALVEQQNQKMQEIEQQRNRVSHFENKLVTINNY